MRYLEDLYCQSLLPCEKSQCVHDAYKEIVPKNEQPFTCHSLICGAQKGKF